MTETQVRETIRRLIEGGKLSTWLDEDEHVEAFQTVAAALSSSVAPIGWVGDITLQGLKAGREGKVYPTEPCSIGATALYAHPAPEALAVIEAARCIRHWHDREPDGMVVSAEHVRALWSALERYDAALAPAP